jgi:hypothetical protein
VVASQGRLDVLVNNAGVPFGRLIDSSGPFGRLGGSCTCGYRD